MSAIIKKTVLAFAGIYALLTLLVAAVNWWLVDLNSGAAMGVLVASGIGAAGVFVKATGRQPDKGERHSLALLCTLVAYTVSIVLFLLVVWLMMSPAEWQVLREQLSEVSPLMAVAVMVVMGLIYYGVLRLTFGWLSRKCYTNKR
ncbi:ABZJ_00895 family protein [Cardiobacteriaceae bacterium TAE3-ERU3]|nr:ABZJ_00895 family protein [Cardiobacteriaceae bacterium TAE3-ERU3]